MILLDDASFAWIHALEFAEALFEAKEVEGMRAGERARAFEFDGYSAGTALGGLHLARLIDQNLAHESRCYGIEVMPILPVRVVLFPEAQIDFMHEFRRLQMDAVLAPDVGSRESSQFGIDDGGQVFSGPLIAIPP